MKQLQQYHFDQVIEILSRPSIHPDVDALFGELVKTVKLMQQGHIEIVNELLAMYDNAAEHNVDISRDHIFRLAQRLASVDNS